MAVVTRDFIDEVIHSGPLTLARARVGAGSFGPYDQASWGQFSTWSLVCEEILDTERPPEWYAAVLAELLRRGFTFEQIDGMRRLAWATAGWLNYDKMLWEWVSLSERDIRRALDWQLEAKIIKDWQHEEGVQFLENPRGASIW